MSIIKKAILFLVFIVSNIVCGGVVFYSIEGNFIAGVWYETQVWLVILIVLACFVAGYKLAQFIDKNQQTQQTK